MADKGSSSGSDSEPNLNDWTVVDGHEDVEGSEASSTSSSLEFVQLEENAALFVRKDSEKRETETEIENDEKAIGTEGGDEAAQLDDSHDSIELIGPYTPAEATGSVDGEEPSEHESEPVASTSMEMENSTYAEEEEEGATSQPTSDPDQDRRSKDGEQEINVEIVGAEVPSGSDSDSDFVKLEPLPGGVGAVLNLPAPEMEASTSSSRSSSSSISSNFRFVQPLLPQNYPVYREASDEEDSVPGDIDDRCESDISGVADDDTDGDLSSVHYCIGDITLTAGRRLYKHSPNRSLNSILSAISMAALFLAIGIGLGHYLGVSRESALRRMQVTKMKIAQDNHLMCLKHASIVKERLNRLKDAARFAGTDQDFLGQDLQTCGDAWRQKYENIMVQNSKLELRIQELETRETNYGQICPHGYPANPRGTDSVIDVPEYVKSVREELNRAELENVDLRREVSRLRYSAHPANTILDQETYEREMKLKLNQLVTENSDLKSAVGKLRYSPFPLSEDGIEKDASLSEYPLPCSAQEVGITELRNELTDVTRQLDAERKLNIMLRMTLARREEEKENNTEPTEGPSAIAKCYQLLGPEIMNKTTDYIKLAKTSATTYISLLVNGTEATKQRLSKKWESIVNLMDGQDPGPLESHLGKLRGEVKQFMAMLFNSTKKLSESSDTNDKINKTAAFFKNITKPVAAHFQDYMNKTKQTVSKLSNTLHATWQVVKNLSNSFIEKHSDKVKEVKEELVQKAKGVQNKIQEKWHSVRGKMEKTGWLKKDSAKQKPHRSKYHKHRPKNHKGHQKQPEKNEFEGERGREYDVPLTQNSAKSFEDKPHHKQRQSNHEQYNEFWKKVDFDPDDYFHEGFFEGNQREWRKHQERLRHLHNRINRLNEDILYSMDDDDIEDMYDDLDDLQDDMDDEDQPQNLQTWLACQVRWWKSRLQRKHRSQDLVKGCGRQIMQWQLRALCKDVCVGKRCSKKKYNLRYLPMCREALHSQDYYCLKRGSVIECHGSDKTRDFHSTESSQIDQHPRRAYDNSHAGSGDYPQTHRQTNRNRRNEEEDMFHFSHSDESDLDVDRVNLTLADQVPDEKEMRVEKPNIAKHSPKDFPVDPESESETAEPEDKEDGSWMFERAVIREYHHHNPDWHFKRAAQRDYERSKPWYVGRSEGREFLRFKQQEKQAD